MLQALVIPRRAAPALGKLSLQALVLVPTRDLAVQVGQVFRDLAAGLPQRLKIELAFGGVSVNPQMMALRGGADLIVATPGRLLDLVEHNAVQLGSLRTLVLDEADRLLDLGFADELGRILKQLPQRRQTLMLSATFAPPVQALAASMLREPQRIEGPDGLDAAPDILQRAIEVDAGRRTQLLRSLIEQARWPRVLVFVASRYGAELVAHKLERAGLPARAFHADFSQGARAEILADFNAGRLQIVVATDVAARGIDIPGLEAVVNYDLPRAALDYQHRIGRTGRAGASGVALSFVSAAGEPHFRLIEKRQGQRVPRERVAGFEPVELALSAEAANGGIKGRRPSKKDKLRQAAAGG
jgi:superfamily II DNA/RNA helicase